MDNHPPHESTHNPPAATDASTAGIHYLTTIHSQLTTNYNHNPQLIISQLIYCHPRKTPKKTHFAHFPLASSAYLAKPVIIITCYQPALVCPLTDCACIVIGVTDSLIVRISNGRYLADFIVGVAGGLSGAAVCIAFNRTLPAEPVIAPLGLLSDPAGIDNHLGPPAETVIIIAGLNILRIGLFDHPAEIVIFEFSYQISIRVARIANRPLLNRPAKFVEYIFALQNFLLVPVLISITPRDVYNKHFFIF